MPPPAQLSAVAVNGSAAVQFLPQLVTQLNSASIITAQKTSFSTQLECGNLQTPAQVLDEISGSMGA